MTTSPPITQLEMQPKTNPNCDGSKCRAEANSQTDANRRGKAHAKAEGIRFIEATQETVVPSASDALEIRQLIVKIEL